MNPLMKPEKTVLLTGASAGIGKELAFLFAERGYGLVLVARNREALEDVAADVKRRFGIESRVLAKDLSRPSAPAEISAELKNAGTDIAILVNNAGFGTFGDFKDADWASQEQMIQLNVASLVSLTHLFLPEMSRRKCGRILNVASTAAFQPGPLMAVYYATKAFVLSFSEAISSELRGTGITVTALCPGPTLTEFQGRAGIEHVRMIRSALVMDARSVAAAGLDGLLKGKRLVIPGLLNWLGAFGVRLAPRFLILRIIQWLQQKKR